MILVRAEAVKSIKSVAENNMKFFSISFEKSVGAIIFKEENGIKKFLLLKYRSGQWDFLKGHSEKGENEKETLSREVFEETKLTEIEVIDGFRISNRFFYTAKGSEYEERIRKGFGTSIFKRVVYYIAQTKKADVVLNFENKAYAWVDFDRAIRMIGNKDSKRMFKKAYYFLDKRGLPR